MIRSRHCCRNRYRCLQHTCRSWVQRNRCAHVQRVAKHPCSNPSTRMPYNVQPSTHAVTRAQACRTTCSQAQACRTSNVFNARDLARVLKRLSWEALFHPRLEGSQCRRGVFRGEIAERRLREPVQERRVAEHEARVRAAVATERNKDQSKRKIYCKRKIKATERSKQKKE